MVCACKHSTPENSLNAWRHCVSERDERKEEKMKRKEGREERGDKGMREDENKRRVIPCII